MAKNRKHINRKIMEPEKDDVLFLLETQSKIMDLQKIFFERIMLHDEALIKFAELIEKAGRALDKHNIMLNDVIKEVEELKQNIKGGKNG